MAMALRLKPQIKLRQNPNTTITHFCSSSLPPPPPSNNEKEDPQSQSEPPLPQSPPTTLQSKFTDIKSTLRKTLSSRPSPSNSAPLEAIRNNLQQFREKTSPPSTPQSTEKVSFKDLFKKNLQSANAGKSHSFDSIRENLTITKLRNNPTQTPNQTQIFNNIPFKELNDRLVKLREEELKEEESRHKGINFRDLREGLEKIGDDTNWIKLNPSGTDTLLTGTPKEHLVEEYFHPDNMSSAEKLKLERKKIRDEFKLSESDCGSSRVQVTNAQKKVGIGRKEETNHSFAFCKLTAEERLKVVGIPAPLQSEVFPEGVKTFNPSEPIKERAKRFKLEAGETIRTPPKKKAHKKAPLVPPRNTKNKDPAKGNDQSISVSRGEEKSLNASDHKRGQTSESGRGQNQSNLSSDNQVSLTPPPQASITNPLAFTPMLARVSGVVLTTTDTDANPDVARGLIWNPILPYDAVKVRNMSVVAIEELRATSLYNLMLAEKETAKITQKAETDAAKAKVDVTKLSSDIKELKKTATEQAGLVTTLKGQLKRSTTTLIKKDKELNKEIAAHLEVRIQKNALDEQVSQLLAGKQELEGVKAKLVTELNEVVNLADAWEYGSRARDSFIFHLMAMVGSRLTLEERVISDRWMVNLQIPMPAVVDLEPIPVRPPVVEDVEVLTQDPDAVIFRSKALFEADGSLASPLVTSSAETVVVVDTSDLVP